MSKDEAKTPMDASVIENATGVARTNTPRVCWALVTLVDEIHEMFPGVPVEYSMYTGLNAALAATFDLTVLDENDRIDMPTLLDLAKGDERVAEVLVSMDADTDKTLAESVLVAMRPNPRTQDSREPFGLSVAFGVLTGGADEDDADDDPDDVWEGGDAFHTSDHVIDAGGAF